MYILKQTYTLNVVAVAAQLSTLGDCLYQSTGVLDGRHLHLHIHLED